MHEGKCKWFVGFVRVFADQACTTLKSAAAVAYLIHDELLGSSAVI